MTRSKCFAALALALTARTACEEIALGYLGFAGRNLLPVLAAFVDYEKNWNVSLVMRFGPPIIAIPGGVHPNASLGAISLHIKMSEGSQEVGMASALDLMAGETGKPVIGMIGPTYSSVSMPVGTVAAVRKVVQVSCCATSPALSNKDSYPFFLRTVPPDSLQARALWKWILQFEVPMAGCLYSAESYGQGLFDVLRELARSHGQQDRVQGQALRNMEREFVAEEARAAVRLVKQIGSRFIILLISWQLAADVRDVLEQEEMLSPAWQIVASETMRDFALNFQRGFMYFRPSGEGEKFSDFQNLWSILALQDIYGLDHLRFPVGLLLSDEFLGEGGAAAMGASEAFSFDAAYAYIIAINKLLHLGRDPSEIQGQVLLEEMRRLRFTGVSGDVSFDENGDRFGTYLLFNIQGEGGEGGEGDRAIVTASYNSHTATFEFLDQLVWTDGSVGMLPPPELLACDPGFYQEGESKQCKKCPKGMFCVGGSTSLPTSCPRGVFASDIGMMNCTPCPRGSFAMDAGSLECIPCPPGTEGPQEGMETCTRCSSGFYMPSAGSSQCLPCGKMQMTPQIGSTRESDCRCPEHSFMCGERGCIPCPSGLYCPEGLGPPEQEGGFWADPNVSQCDFSVFRCRDQFECPPGMMGRCSVGREGLACNNCQASHYPQGSVCEQCREGDAMPVILLILFLLFVLWIISVSRWDPSQVSLQVAQSDGADDMLQ